MGSSYLCVCWVITTTKSHTRVSDGGNASGHTGRLAVERAGHWVKRCEIPNTSDTMRNVDLKTQINQPHKTTTETDSSEAVNRLTNLGSLHDGCWFWCTFITNVRRQLPTDAVKHRKNRANIYKEWNALRHSHINKLKDANHSPDILWPCPMAVIASMFGLTQWSISLGSVKILTRKDQMAAALQMSGGKRARKPAGLETKVMEVTFKFSKFLSLLWRSFRLKLTRSMWCS